MDRSHRTILAAEKRSLDSLGSVSVVLWPLSPAPALLGDTTVSFSPLLPAPTVPAVFVPFPSTLYAWARGCVDTEKGFIGPESRSPRPPRSRLAPRDAHDPRADFPAAIHVSAGRSEAMRTRG